MSKKLGFTMAEILLSLTIIGVVAAITLPSLMANINERTWNTQRKALYARMSQAIAMMPQLNGYGEYEGTNTNDVVSVTKDTAAETFLTAGLSKVMKINNICDSAHLADCGIVASYTALNGTVKSMPTKLSELNIMFTSTYLEGGVLPQANIQNYIDTSAAAFETQNGESLVAFYNHECLPDRLEGYQPAQTKMCANFIYDLNGNKGPNSVGKDIGFITALYSDNPVVVAPEALSSNLSSSIYKGSEITGVCSSANPDTRLPNRNELASIWINRNLLGIEVEGFVTYWSGQKYSATKTYVQNFSQGDSGAYANTYTAYVRCIKR